jgi:hypothetical protein
LHGKTLVRAAAQLQLLTGISDVEGLENDLPRPRRANAVPVLARTPTGSSRGDKRRARAIRAGPPDKFPAWASAGAPNALHPDVYFFFLLGGQGTFVEAVTVGSFRKLTSILPGNPPFGQLVGTVP